MQQGFSIKMALPAGVPIAAMDTFDTGCGPAAPVADTSTASGACERSYGPLSAPSDLLAFVRAHPVRYVSDALCLSRGTVHNLLAGYWPADARKIMQAWDLYKGRHFKRSTSWFIRRVGADGLLRHGRQVYGAAQLASRAGELLAVARGADGALLAVALELPAERFPLQRVEG